MNLNQLAQEVTLREGLHKSLSIAQVKEVIRILCNMFPTIYLELKDSASPLQATPTEKLPYYFRVGPVSLATLLTSGNLPPNILPDPDPTPPEMVPEKGELGYEEKKTVSFPVISSVPKKKKSKGKKK